MRAAGGSLLAQEVCGHLERASGVARHLEEHGRAWERELAAPVERDLALDRALRNVCDECRDSIEAAMEEE